MSEGHEITNLSQITDLIYLGTNLCCMADSHTQILLRHGIKADIDLEIERQDQAPGVEVYLWLPVEDKKAPTLEQLKTGVAVIDSLVKNNIKVYIHCKNGHERSPVLLAAYFIFVGMSIEEAIAKIKSKRPEIHLEELQYTALKNYQNEIL